MSAPRSPAEALLTDLSDEQRDAVTTAASPLAVLAGAGSGKTRVLTRRIAWQAASGTVDPRRVLAVTFTRRAAGELRKRLRGLGLADGPAAGTFHAVALAMLRRWWAEHERHPPKILQSRRALLADLRPRWSPRNRSAVEVEIGWARARMITPEAYPEAAAAARRRLPSLRVETIAAAYSAYDEAKKRRRLVDFDDMLALTHRVLTQDDRFAAAQRWRQSHLLVDEFQDVNPLQFEVLKAWLSDESTLVVVGDPRQAIYAWNGAEPDLLARIDRHLPGVAVVHLSANFRSTPEICEAAAAIGDVDPQPTVQAHGDRPKVREVLGAAGAALSGRVPSADFAAAEARSVASAVRGSRRPTEPWARQAVLARTNAQLAPIREALVAAGIPVRAPRGRGLLGLPDVEDFLAAYDRAERLSVLAADLSAEFPRAVQAAGAAGRAGHPGDGHSGNEHSGARHPGAGHDPCAAPPGCADVRAHLLEPARDALALDPASTVGDFVDLLRSDGGPAPTADGVDVSTFHQAKGLEWPIVHLVGVEDGFVPLASSRSRAAREEERRLLYVAATRAEHELHISWCRLRTVGGELSERRPSPWIESLAANAETTADSVSALPVAAARLADLRAGLEADRAADAEASRAEPATAATAGAVPPAGPRDKALRQAALEGLRAWRERAARNADVKPAAVLADDALERLADLRPACMEDLAAVEGLGPSQARRFGPRILEITSRR